MDKQKQIEEMAKEVAVAGKSAGEWLLHETKEMLNRNGHFRSSEHTRTLSDIVAEYLYNAGYRKIPEGAVVLTREEYDVLKVKEKEKHWLETCMTIWQNAKIDARKETAEKYHAEMEKAIDSVPNATKEFVEAWKAKNDEICKELEGEK